MQGTVGSLRCSSIRSIVALGSLFLCIGYAVLLAWHLAPFWFNPHWTTDDAVQQLFPFHAVLHPEIFPNDLIFEAMRGYLAPLHYLLGAGITYLTTDPIMTGHWMMFIQVSLASTFLFGGVYFAARRSVPIQGWKAGLTPAAFSLLWFLHSQPIFQRMTGGLPRGWAAPILCAYLFCLISRRHRGVLTCLLVGSLLNPPATFLAAVNYGIWLLYCWARQTTRQEAPRPIRHFMIIAPLLIGVTVWSTHRPATIGQMASFTEASSMPEFQRAGGRFGFLPLLPPGQELSDFAFRSFINKLHPAPSWWKGAVPPMVLTVVAALLFAAYRKRRELIPTEIVLFGLSALLVYFVSRQFAFKLYLPDRHILTPVGLAFFYALPLGIWRLCAGANEHRALRGSVALGALACTICFGSGSGLETAKRGTANFNYHDRTRGGVFAWIRKHTPPDSLIAGHPTHLDPVQLFGMRKGYATTETWHPFFGAYNEEIKRRLALSFRAHYAKTLPEFVTILEPERINYFLFARNLMRPDNLKKAGYLEPLNTLVRELASHDSASYAYFNLPLSNRDVVPFSDEQSVLVDIGALKRFLSQPVGGRPNQTEHVS